MAETIWPIRMTGALLSGVIYLNQRGEVQQVHWCLTPDGESVSADVQPVIRVGSLGEANTLLPAMLAELTERFAKAAATEAAKAAQSKKRAAHTGQGTIPQTGKESDMQVESGETAGAHTPEGAEELEELQEVPDEADEQAASAGDQPEASLQAPAKPEGKKSGKSKEPPAMASLFDGLDLS